MDSFLRTSSRKSPVGLLFRRIIFFTDLLSLQSNITGMTNNQNISTTTSIGLFWDYFPILFFRVRSGP